MQLNFVLPQMELKVVGLAEVLDNLRLGLEPAGSVTVDLSAYQPPACYCDLGTISEADLESDEEPASTDIEIDEDDYDPYYEEKQLAIRDAEEPARRPQYPDVPYFTARLYDQLGHTFADNITNNFEEALGWCKGLYRMVQDGLMPKQLRSGAVLQKVTISAEDHHDGGLFCLYLYEPVTD